jgi:AbrB family looped-hinge helix DNA binding protein
MSKVTSKRQVTLPKELAEEYGIQPGDEIDWERAGDAIRVIPRKRPATRELSVPERLALFDEGTRRHVRRWQDVTPAAAPTQGRGWTRDELHGRGRAG